MSFIVYEFFLKDNRKIFILKQFILFLLDALLLNKCFLCGFNLVFPKRSLHFFELPKIFFDFTLFGIRADWIVSESG